MKSASMNQRVKSVAKRGNFAVPTGWAGPDRRFGEVIKENLDVLTGTRGDPLDRAITARDLISSGIARLPSGMTSFSGASNGLVPVSDSFETLDIPPAPTNLQANGAFENILLTWDLKQYKGHAFTQIYRHTSDDIANATLLGQLSGYTGVYADQVGESATYYYWVRAVNNNGEEGPFNSSTGTQGQTAPDVSFLLNKLSNAITSSELATSLTEPIDKIDGIESFTGYSSSYSGNSLLSRMGAVETTANNAATSAQLQSEQTTRANADTALSQDITTLSSGYSDPDGGSGTVTLQQAMSTQATLNGELKSSYAIKIDNNGAVAGFGLASTANSAGNITSEFIVNADRFAIMRGGSNTTTATVPFVVQATATTLNGETVPAGVYMADAFIKNGSIQSAKIGSLNADKITAGTIDAARIGANTIEASKLKIDGATITANSSGQIVVGTLNANVITSGTLNTSRLNIDNATITNSSGVLKIKNLGVDTLQIKDQAVTIPVGAYTAGNVYSFDSHDSNSISYATAQSVSFTSTGSPVAIFWSFLTETDGGDTDSGDQGYARIYVRIKRGSTVIQDLGYLVSTGYTGSGFKFEFLSGCFIHTGSSGAVTYRVEVGRQGHEANVSKRSMVTMELKK